MTDALGRLMLAFDGTELPEPMRRRFAERPAAGVTLFRYRNVASPAQVRALTDDLQSLAPPGEPFLVAIDQEGGQLLGLGEGSTPFPGNMALGAAGDPTLTRRVGAAIGRELRAVGVNVNYAPVADLAVNPANPSLGVRSFGDDATTVASHVAAFVEGMESSGVVATVKHFPGKGDVDVDTHHALATVRRDAAGFAERELVPFRAGFGAGASMVMAGHVAAPGLGTGDRPATVSRAVVFDLLRRELGYDGVAISDAFDMDALSPGDARTGDAIAALNAGLDLILLGGRSDVPAFDAAVSAAAAGGHLDADTNAAALDRVRRLRLRLGSADPAPGLASVGSPEHLGLAREVAERSVTLVRNRDALLPLRVAATDRILVVMPRPIDRTPADTSSTVRAGLASAIARHHANVHEVVVAADPSSAELAAVLDAARASTLAIIGSISASLVPSQAALVRAVVETGVPTVTIALRTPWDLDSYPAAGTHVCTYSVLEPSLEAVADALFGRIPFSGALPVRSAVVA
jgi:beta-N-acetylhexosaminidase